MIYQYKCDCGEVIDVVKSYREIDRTELCKVCGRTMMRDITAFCGQMSPHKFDTHYNHAFGKVIGSKAELKEAVRRHNETHGTDLQEVGNEKLKSEKPRVNYDLDGMKKEIYGLLHK